MSRLALNASTDLAFPITFRKARLYSEFAEIPNVQDNFREFSTPGETDYGERAPDLPAHEELGDYKIGKPNMFSCLRRRNGAAASQNSCVKPVDQ